MIPKIPRTKAPHITKERPRDEPYDLHKARQKAQQKALKEYLRGYPVWRSCVLVPIYKDASMKRITSGSLKKGRVSIRPDGFKKLKIQGTYVKEPCLLCGEKKCKCLKEMLK